MFNTNAWWLDLDFVAPGRETIVVVRLDPEVVMLIQDVDRKAGLACASTSNFNEVTGDRSVFTLA